ncbi:hypothetical protein F4777DRAFT_549624 [Nemania sp. FL0916]|nr:hypothetical protein F4777DRAFT_549624 [Nemania sp. FL0916]
MTVDSRGRISSSHPPPIYLVPWDPNSQQHVDRMKLQRIACGWKVDQVDGWRESQRNGELGLHWVVLHPDHPETAPRLKRHLLAFPDEQEALSDTSTTILGRAHKLNPSSPSFCPVGHIALDSVTCAPELQSSLANGILSLMNFYISTPLQNLGLGGVALRCCEEMARDELGAKAITLEAIANEECSIDSPRRIAMKREVPIVTNQDWYARRGYKIYAAKDVAWIDVDDTGKEWKVRAWFMRKDLV